MFLLAKVRRNNYLFVTSRLIVHSESYIASHSQHWHITSLKILRRIHKALFYPRNTGNIVPTKHICAKQLSTSVQLSKATNFYFTEFACRQNFNELDTAISSFYFFIFFFFSVVSQLTTETRRIPKSVVHFSELIRCQCEFFQLGKSISRQRSRLEFPWIWQSLASERSERVISGLVKPPLVDVLLARREAPADA